MLEHSVDTQFGTLTVREEAGEIIALRWGPARSEGASPLMDEAVAQLRAYDAGNLEVFDLPLRLSGAELTRAVGEEMLMIPYGETATYGEIAKRLGVSAQSVGQACGANPIPIIIPCHRVLGAKGLTGFSGAGGVETKVALLKHEKAGGFLI
jgi:methylated-DNA-[protein]-cysteine S-methyltransferase